jgi:hypothetical protein
VPWSSPANKNWSYQQVVLHLQAKSAQPGDRESVKMAEQARLGFEAVTSSQSLLTTRWNYPKKMVALFYPPV